MDSEARAWLRRFDGLLMEHPDHPYRPSDADFSFVAGFYRKPVIRNDLIVGYELLVVEEGTSKEYLHLTEGDSFSLTYTVRGCKLRKRSRWVLLWRALKDFWRGKT